MHVEIVDTNIPVLKNLFIYAVIKMTIYIMEFTIIWLKSIGLCLILCFSHHFLIFINYDIRKFYITTISITILHY